MTHADKGFLILLEDGELSVKAARNVARENIEDAVERVSDSIVQRGGRDPQAAHRRRRAGRPGVSRPPSRS